MNGKLWHRAGSFVTFYCLWYPPQQWCRRSCADGMLHCKYSCDCCCPSCWIKELKAFGRIWSQRRCPPRHGDQEQNAVLLKWHWMRAEPLQFSHYGGKLDSFIDSKIVATKWKQITDWNNRCGCINWVQCFDILFHFQSTLRQNSLTLNRAEISVSEVSNQTSSDDTKQEH